MNESIITQESLREKIKEHEDAITQLEAVVSFQKMAETHKETSEMLNWMFDEFNVGTTKSQQERCDHYIECANRIYRNYFNKWIRKDW